MTILENAIMLVIRPSMPSFRNNHDKVAYAVHASFIAAGFLLIGTGPPAFADDALLSTSTEEVGIEHWNEVDDEYGFLYLNPNNGNKKVLVKGLTMGDKLMVDVLSDGGNVLFRFVIAVGEFVSEKPGSDYNSQYKNLGKLVGSLEMKILSKLNGSSVGCSTHVCPRCGCGCRSGFSGTPGISDFCECRRFPRARGSPGGPVTDP